MDWKSFDYTKDLETLVEDKYYLFYVNLKKKCKTYVGYKDMKYGTINFITPNIKEMCGPYGLASITHYMEIQV